MYASHAPLDLCCVWSHIACCWSHWGKHSKCAVSDGMNGIVYGQVPLIVNWLLSSFSVTTQTVPVLAFMAPEANKTVMKK